MITIEQIQAIAARRFGVGLEELRGPRTFKSLTLYRRIAMYLARDTTRASYPEIAFAFNRDHSTVRHAVLRVAKEIESDEEIRDTVEALRDQVSRLRERAKPRRRQSSSRAMRAPTPAVSHVRGEILDDGAGCRAPSATNSTSTDVQIPKPQRRRRADQGPTLDDVKRTEAAGRARAAAAESRIKATTAEVRPLRSTRERINGHSRCPR